MTGIPMGNIQSEERQRLSSAEDILHKRVVGQNHAIKSILDAVFESRSGLNKKDNQLGLSSSLVLQEQVKLNWRSLWQSSFSMMIPQY